MFKKKHVSLILLMILSACGGSSNDEKPPADDPVVGPDCLGDIASDGTTYCVDNTSRTVTATKPDGSIDWSVTLQPSDSTGDIDTLVLIDDQPWLIAGSGTWMGQVKSDQMYVSYAGINMDSGGFIRTSTLNNYDYQRDERALPAIGIGKSVYIATDVYGLIAGADSALPDSWQFVGASIARIEPIVGQLQGGMESLSLPIGARRLYPEQHVNKLARTPSGALVAELDNATEKLDADTLLPKTSDPARALLNGKAHELVTPVLVTAIRGDGLDDLATRLLMLAENVRTTATATFILESNAPDEPPAHGVDSDVLERIEYTCMDSGKLTLERQKQVTYNDGGFAKTEIHEVFQYADCKLQLDVGDDLNSAGSYRLDGSFINDELNDVAFQNFTHDRISHEWSTFTLDSADQRSSLTTAQTIEDTQYIVSGPPPTTRTTTINSHVERDAGEVVLSITDGNYLRTQTSTFGDVQPYLSISASGSIAGSRVGTETIEVSIDPPIERNTVSIVPDAAPGVQTMGQVQVTVTTDNTMTITAVETPAPYAGDPPPNSSATMDYVVNDGKITLSETKSLESLYIPVSVHVID